MLTMDRFSSLFGFRRFQIYRKFTLPRMAGRWDLSFILDRVAICTMDGFNAILCAGCRNIHCILCFPAMSLCRNSALFGISAGIADMFFLTVFRTGHVFNRRPFAEAVSFRRDGPTVLDRIAVSQ